MIKFFTLNFIFKIELSDNSKYNQIYVRKHILGVGIIKASHSGGSNRFCLLFQSGGDRFLSVPAAEIIYHRLRYQRNNIADHMRH
jgi:hypothetical protein